MPHNNFTAYVPLFLTLVAIKECFWGLSSTIRLRFKQGEFGRLRGHHWVDEVCEIPWNETWHPVGLRGCKTLGDQRRFVRFRLLFTIIHLRSRCIHALGVVMIYADSRRSRLIAALCVRAPPGDATAGLLHAPAG